MSNTLSKNVNELIDVKNYETILKNILSYAKKLGANEAEVGASVNQGLSISVREGDIETLEFNRDKAVGVTVYVNQQKGSASTTDLSLESIQATVESAIFIAKIAEPDKFCGLARAELMAKNVPDLGLYYPWDISVEEAKLTAIECEKAGLNYDKKIKKSDGVTLATSQGYSLYANSHGFIGGVPSSGHSLSCVMIASGKQGNMERDYDYTYARDPKLLWQQKKVGELAAKNTIARLDSQKIKTQSTPVIFHSRVARTLLGHFIGAISGGSLYRKASFLLDSINTPVFAKHINIIEQPHLKGGLGSAYFDSEGVATKDKDIVKNGVLQSYILSSYSAKKMGLETTANAGGVHNLIAQTSDKDLDALLKQMDTGLLVTELMGQGVNLVNGDYSRGASGFWVEKGQIQYPVSEITIAGNLKDMFMNIIDIANDTDVRASTKVGSILVEQMMVAGT